MGIYNKSNYIICIEVLSRELMKIIQHFGIQHSWFNNRLNKVHSITRYTHLTQ